MIIIAAIVVVLAVAAGIILMPRHGKTVADTWSPYDTYGGQKWIRTIEKQPGKDFKILQITDTQLYMLPGDNKKALELTKELVTEEKPDLVVLTGDNCIRPVYRLADRRCDRLHGKPRRAVGACFRQPRR